MAACRTTNVDGDPAKPLLPVRVIEESTRFSDDFVLIHAGDHDICFVRVLPAHLASPRNKSRNRLRLPVSFLLAHEAIPAVKVLVEQEVFRPAACTLGNNPKEELSVDFGRARPDRATRFVGRSRV